MPKLIKTPRSDDNRGYFRKIYSEIISHETMSLENVSEIFSTSSSKFTIRGMHFQKSPHATGKLIWVTHGSILDFVVDIRDTSSFGEIYQYFLSSDSDESLWVPPGFAHGFQAMVDKTIVNYATDGSYNSDSDVGILWNSFGAKWAQQPSQLSRRDSEFCTLEEYRLQLETH